MGNMNIKDRKPRPSRFVGDSHEAKLVRLRDKAPTLGSNPKLRIYAILGSALLCLTVLGFYFAMQIYKAVTEDRRDASMIEVEQAPELQLTETQKALQRLEEEQAAEEAALEKELEALKAVDLLEETENPPPGGDN